MAKKKPIIDLKSKNLQYTQGNVVYQLINFNQSNMTLTLLAFENNTQEEIKNFPFAHLPKEIKKLVKPN